MKRRFIDDSYRREPWFKALCAALLSCKNEEQMADFLRDIGSLSELQAWSERLEVSKQVAQGLSYRAISKNTGASTTTVTRAAKCIENGTGGLRRILNTHRHHRMHHVSRQTIEEKIEQISDAKETKTENVSVLQKYLGKKS